jgi:hypothetical protein
VIYEGAVIRRLVTPNYPGDQTLDVPAAEVQCRVEYVRDDAKAPAPGSWTREFDEAHRYPNHLAADHRAKEIGGNCFARVVPREDEERSELGTRISDFQNLSGDASATSTAELEPAACKLAVKHGSHSSPAQNILPAESGPSDRASKRPRSIAPGVEVSVDARAAGKSFSKRKARKEPRASARLTKLRESAARVSDRTWYRQGQYA